MRIRQWYTNPGRQVARATKFCTVALNVCGPSVWNLLRVHLLAPTFLSWLLDFLKVCATLTFHFIAESLSVSCRLFDRTLGTKKCQILKWQRQRSPLKEMESLVIKTISWVLFLGWRTGCDVRWGLEFIYLRQAGKLGKVLLTDLGVDGEGVKPILNWWSAILFSLSPESSS